jgi:hypothetical protein
MRTNSHGLSNFFFDLYPFLVLCPVVPHRIWLFFCFQTEGWNDSMKSHVCTRREIFLELYSFFFSGFFLPQARDGSERVGKGRSFGLLDFIHPDALSFLILPLVVVPLLYIFPSGSGRIKSSAAKTLGTSLNVYFYCTTSIPTVGMA